MDLLEEVVLKEAALTAAVLTEAVLSEVVLTEVVLTAVVLTEVILVEAVLTEVVLMEEKILAEKFQKDKTKEDPDVALESLESGLKKVALKHLTSEVLEGDLVVEKPQGARADVAHLVVKVLVALRVPEVDAVAVAPEEMVNPENLEEVALGGEVMEEDQAIECRAKIVTIIKSLVVCMVSVLSTKV